MSIRNQNWYNLQSTRRYPIDEKSLGVDDAGVFIRDDILVDCHIRFPNNYGNYVYVQGITVSPGLVTVLFGASQQADTTPGATIAVVSVVKPVTANINYEITPLQPGVSGWVTFGPGIETEFAGRYTAPVQSFISPRCARSYTPLPVPTLGKLGLRDALQGVINLSGELPIRVRYVQNAGQVVKFVNGAQVPVSSAAAAIIVELDQAQITESYNPLEQFLGPCGSRPESGTCPKTPIENINGVTPDCNGNIDIVFTGFDAQLFSDCGGVDVITDVDLPTACETAKPKRKEFSDICCEAKFTVESEAYLQSIPMADRTVGMIVKTEDTNERWSLDANLLSWSITSTAEACAWPDPTEKIPDIIEEELPPPPEYPCAVLPVCVDFNACDGGLPNFDIQSGTFMGLTTLAPELCPHCDANGDPLPIDPEAINTGGFTITNHGAAAATDTSGLNIATFKNCATDWSINNTITTEFKIGTFGLERNGGLVLNYQRRLNSFKQIITTYVAVVLDVARGQLRVLRYTNNATTVEGNVEMRVKTNAWYRLSATPTMNGSTVSISVAAEEMTATNPSSATMVINISAESYGDLIGPSGLFASRSYTYFNKFTIVE